MRIDLLLAYYDNPQALGNWLYRLVHHTDFRAHADATVIVCDTGTPEDRVSETLGSLRAYEGKLRMRYLRVDTSALRAAQPPEVLVRPNAVAHNTALKHVCDGELVVHSGLAQIFLPTYFAEVVAKHTENPTLLLQPRQHRIEVPGYAESGYRLPYGDLVRRRPARRIGGMPDWSILRRHLLAIGGWDEDYVAWGMVDIDLCARLTGYIDTGERANSYFRRLRHRPPNRPYSNYGLDFERAYRDQRLLSLICNDYGGHEPLGTPQRMAAAQQGLVTFFKKWGQILRNSPTDSPYTVQEL